MSVTYNGGQQENRKAKAVAIWAVLKDKAAFDALTTAQKAEVLRLAIVYLIKDKLKDELPD